MMVMALKRASEMSRNDAQWWLKMFNGSLTVVDEGQPLLSSKNQDTREYTNINNSFEHG